MRQRTKQQQKFCLIHFQNLLLIFIIYFRYYCREIVCFFSWVSLLVVFGHKFQTLVNINTVPISQSLGEMIISVNVKKSFNDIFKYFLAVSLLILSWPLCKANTPSLEDG